MIAETYVTQIVKKIRCSRKKRREIHRQILADITYLQKKSLTMQKRRQASMRTGADFWNLESVICRK